MGRSEDNEAEAAMAGKLKTMATSPLSVVLQLLMADLTPDGDGMTDGELLARFLGSRDEDSLAALVHRHASMVWGVCRHLLNHHDAEDAFQATFLVLVRKAADVPREAVANWLYGVARQTAVRLRATAAKRGRRETQVVNMPELTVPEVRDADLQAVLDEELSRLPDHYRGVLILCDLEGMTRKAVARQLGIPEGSVASRLARARALLAKRLAQRGVVLSGTVAAALSAGSASASVPPVLVASTIKATSLLVAGRAAGVVSAKVAALTEGVVKAMFLSKLKSTVRILLCVLGVSLSAASLSGVFAQGDSDKLRATANEQQPAQDDPPQAPAAPAVPAQADGKVGQIKVEARGRVIEKKNMDGSTPYFLRVDQKKPAPAVEWLIRTKTDKATVIRHVLDLKDAEVVLTDNLAWLPKGARADSDDDYTLGFVIQEEAQLRCLDQKDQSPHYIKVEARGDWMIQDNSLVVLVQLQETPAKRVFVSGPWGLWSLDRLSAALQKTTQATIAGHATWEPQVGADLVPLRLNAPQLVDPPLSWRVTDAEQEKQKEQK
jgi:RNA polymerase sigma factor (sigma-70 family)